MLVQFYQKLSDYCCFNLINSVETAKINKVEKMF